MKTQISIVLDKSIKNNSFFNSVSEIIIEKSEMFTYSVLNEDIPDHIQEHEYFEKQQKLIPALEIIYDDWICFEQHRIVNLSRKENSKRISELIGVGLGVKYFTSLLDVPLHTVKKIEEMTSSRKYLDFETLKNNQKFELETKGTTVEKSLNRFLSDINDKKKDSLRYETATRIGTVAIARKVEELSDTYLYVTDDFNTDEVNEKYNIRDFFKHYLIYLSFIYDNSAYNKLYNYVYSENDLRANMVNFNKFFTKITVDNQIFYGECFDRRLISNKSRNKIFRDSDKAYQAYEKITKLKGKTKYFVGIHEDVLTALNRLDLKFFESYNRKNVSLDINKLNNTDDQSDFSVLNSNGLLFLKRDDSQESLLTNVLTEHEVIKRLGLMYSYENGEPHECGAPCRSREKEGKSCEILTYRGNCHFHR